jgi:hypothetical protein
MSKKKRESVSAPVLTSVFETDDSLLPSEQQSSQISWFVDSKADWKKKLLYPSAGFALLVLIAVGAMAKHGWLPRTDALTGKKTGWFGVALPHNASSSWNPMAAPLTTPTPQLSKEYIYAGGRMLAVEDANASAAPPADLAIWRPSDGNWWVMGGQGSTQTTVQWGSGGGNGVLSDIPVMGDYDGDGKTDFSIFRPGTGTWWIKKSSTGDTSSYAVGFGLQDDKVAQADYDGDGRTDPAVYRPSTGQWYILKSSDGTVDYRTYGASGDIPVPADYDGDGKADLALWRSSNATFYIEKSSDGLQTGGQFPGGTEAVPADYDGDGKADMAVRKANLEWVIYQSSNNQFLPTISYPSSGALTGDKAVHNDYDGDGKVDIAVWRPSNGNWYIRQSSKIGQAGELRQVQWGVAGDVPVPAFYRR